MTAAAGTTDKQMSELKSQNLSERVARVELEEKALVRFLANNFRYLVVMTLNICRFFAVGCRSASNRFRIV